MSSCFGYNFSNIELLLPFSIEGYNPVEKSYKFSTDKPIEISKYKVSKHVTNLNTDVTLPLKVNANLASLLGYIIANGSFGIGSLQFSSNDEDLLEEFTYYSENLFNKCVCTNDSPNRVKTVSINSVLIFNYIVNDILGGKATARYKKVPECIKHSSRESVRCFLRGLFDCDSHLENNSSFIFNTASEYVAKEVHKMLLGFGVIGALSSFDNVKGYEGHKYWDIKVSGKYIEPLISNILYDSLIYSEETFTKKKVNTNVDIIPNLNVYLRSELTKIRDTFEVKNGGCYKVGDSYARYQINKHCKVSKNKGITYEFIDKVLQGWENDLPEDQENAVKHLIKLFRYLKEKDIFFDKNTPDKRSRRFVEKNFN